MIKLDLTDNDNPKILAHRTPPPKNKFGAQLAPCNAGCPLLIFNTARNARFRKRVEWLRTPQWSLHYSLHSL